jgi:D-arabinose 1-dehydrogenase-like Zn-dependent alcohol dehydrogenase
MKAVVLREPGNVNVLVSERVDDPRPAARDLIVEVEACGVSFHDVLVRQGVVKFGVELPCVLGHEISGRVVEVGKDVRHARVGDRVATVQRYHVCGQCGFCRTGREPLCAERKFLGDCGMNGGYAEYVAVEEDNVARVPDGVTLAHAAMAASAIGSPYNGIRDVAQLRMGESVLVTGAGGGLGIHSVQIAKLGGAIVLAQTTSASKADLLRRAGADHVVVHRRGEDFSSEVRALTEGRGVDLVVDNVGTPLFEPTRKSLAVGGRWLMIGQLSGEPVPFNPAQLFIRNQSMLSVMSTTREQLTQVLVLMGRGRLEAVVGGCVALEQAAQAHLAVESGQIVGRMLISPKAEVVAQCAAGSGLSA